jgi:hypothetical protein
MAAQSPGIVPESTSRARNNGDSLGRSSEPRSTLTNRSSDEARSNEVTYQMVRVARNRQRVVVSRRTGLAISGHLDPRTGSANVKLWPEPSGLASECWLGDKGRSQNSIVGGLPYRQSAKRCQIEMEAGDGRSGNRGGLERI